MDVCSICGQKLNESSRFCTNCGSTVAAAKNNITTAPKTRIEKRKVRSKTIVKLVVGFGSVIGLLLVLCVAYFIIKDQNKNQLKTEVAASKTIGQSKDHNLTNNAKSNNGNPTENNSGESSNVTSSDFILPNSDKRLLSEADIATLTKGQLRFARNEIYARHGYVFKSADLQKYFSSKSWYHANPSYDGSLNKIEKENVTFLQTRENRL